MSDTSEGKARNLQIWLLIVGGLITALLAVCSAIGGAMLYGQRALNESIRDLTKEVSTIREDRKANDGRMSRLEDDVQDLKKRMRAQEQKP